MIIETENIFYECTGCMAGMELFADFEGVKRKHRISFEADLGKFFHVKKGQFVLNKSCPNCEKEVLIRV
tara:strand:+ start:1307 stop:1513 length:207 start_codon:yes stop_codon:yes gene_type:complete